VQLVITEVSQIQPYIFASNRMRENVGASYLVVQATEDWALNIVNEVAPRNNINSNDSSHEKKLEDNKRIEDPAARLDAEVLYAGGGNFVVLFLENPEDLEITPVLIEFAELFLKAHDIIL